MWCACSLWCSVVFMCRLLYHTTQPVLWESCAPHGSAWLCTTPRIWKSARGWFYHIWNVCMAVLHRRKWEQACGERQLVGEREYVLHVYVFLALCKAECKYFWSYIIKWFICQSWTNDWRSKLYTDRSYNTYGHYDLFLNNEFVFPGIVPLCLKCMRFFNAACMHLYIERNTTYRYGLIIIWCHLR